MKSLAQMRAKVRPDIRQAIDGFGLVFAITRFFCLLNSAHDGIVNRNRQFDPQRWWYPIYQAFQPAAKARCQSGFLTIWRPFASNSNRITFAR